jgi:outer membrane protein TolC
MRTFIFLVIAFFSVSCFAETEDIKALQKQKIEALTEMVKVCMLQYQMGAGDFTSYANAQHALVAAQLESVDNSKERIALLTAQLKLSEAVYKHSEDQFAAGVRGGGIINVLQAKILCLDIRIQLAKEKNVTHFQLLKKQ